MAGRGTAMLLMALAGAPFQCSSEPDPNERMEETPGQALYELAEQFRKEGNEPARRTTLKRLMQRYPSSRFAKMAEQELKQGAAEGRRDGEADDGADGTGPE